MFMKLEMYIEFVIVLYKNINKVKKCDKEGRFMSKEVLLRKTET